MRRLRMCGVGENGSDLLARPEDGECAAVARLLNPVYPSPAMSYADFVAFRRSLPRTPRLERQNIRARGVTFAVFTAPPVGNEPPVVCINGGMLYDHSMLWPALSPFAERRQAILNDQPGRGACAERVWGMLYDRRGRGPSSAPTAPSAASIEADALDVAAIRRALGIRKWDVLGHSWGGGIAMLASAGDITCVRRLILVDSVGPTSDWMALLRAAVLD